MTPDRIEFLPDETATRPTAAIPIYEIRIDVSGESSEIYLFRPEGAEAPQISVVDPEVVELVASFGCQPASRILAKARRRRTLRWTPVAVVAALVVALLLGPPLVLPRLPSAWLARWIPLERERAIGQALRLARPPGFRIADRGRAPELLTALMARLQPHSGLRSEPPLAVGLNQEADVNAFTLMGGQVIVNSGLIRDARSIEEVAGVIAHELGHVERRHVFKGIAGQLGLSGGAMLLAIFVSPDLATWVSRGGTLAQLGFSREQEREADEVGLSVLAAAQIPADGFAGFLERLGAAHPSRGAAGVALRILSTHPLSPERVSFVRERAAGFPSGSARPLPVTLDELQTAAAVAQ